MLGKFSFSFSRCSFSGDEGDGLSMEVFSTRTVELLLRNTRPSNVRNKDKQINGIG